MSELNLGRICYICGEYYLNHDNETLDRCYKIAMIDFANYAVGEERKK